jgi:mitotic spindle assembly checkpoint protein MAD2
MKGEVQKLVIVVTGLESKEVLERWAFEVHAEQPKTGEYVSLVHFVFGVGVMRLNFPIHCRPAPTKPMKEITSEIQAIIRQITASVSFLPLLDEQCTFDLLVYTDKNSEVPALWEESDPRFIKDPTEVRLRSFSTKVCCCNLHWWCDAQGEKAF